MPQYGNPKKSFNRQPPSYRDISKIISKMKAGAAACPLDQVSVLTLKKCPYLRTYLTCLMPKLWKGQNIPSVWKKAVTILIFKSDNPSNPKNFRPITLENVFVKVYTSFIRNRIFEYLKANDYIECRVQKGFIAKISGTIEHTPACIHYTARQKKTENISSDIVGPEKCVWRSEPFPHIHSATISSYSTRDAKYYSELYSGFSTSITTKTF